MKKKEDSSWERRVGRRLASINLEEPGQGALRRAYALFVPEAPAPSILARLLFDSIAEPAPVGLRGAVASERRLLFQVLPPSGEGDPRQLDLEVRRGAEGTLELTGHLTPCAGKARVKLRSGDTHRVGTIGPLGEFKVKRLPGRLKTVRLEIHGEDLGVLTVPEVPLLEPEAPEE